MFEHARLRMPTHRCAPKQLLRAIYNTVLATVGLKLTQFEMVYPATNSWEATQYNPIGKYRPDRLFGCLRKLHVGIINLIQ